MDASGNPKRGATAADSAKTLRDLALPLRECGELATLRLSAALSEALELAVDYLFEEASRSPSPQERESLIDAAELARQRRHALVCDFMRHFEHRYTRACLRKHDVLAGDQIDFDADQLQVVEHHLLDDSLDPGKIAEAIQNTSWQILQRLTTQFQLMLRTEYLIPLDLPVGPKAIEVAVSDAIQDQLWRQRAKPKLARALRWPLAARVGLFYRDLADHLNARDLRMYADLGRSTVGVPVAAPAPVTSVSTPPVAVRASSPPPSAAPPAPAETPASMHPAVQAAAPRVQESAVALTGAATNPGQAKPGPLTQPSPGGRGEKRAIEGEMDEGVAPGTDQGIDEASAPNDAAAELESLTRAMEAAYQHQVAVPETAAEAQPAAPKADFQPPAVGTWLSYKDRSGVSMELKLAWISPRGSLMVLSNRAGQRALSLSAPEFQRATEEGRINLLSKPESMAVTREQVKPKSPLRRSA
jgi:hypothetical protein